MNAAAWAHRLSSRAQMLAEDIEHDRPAGLNLAELESLLTLLPAVLSTIRGRWRTDRPTVEGRYAVQTLRGEEIGLWEGGQWFNEEGSRRIGVSHWRAAP